MLKMLTELFRFFEEKDPGRLRLSDVFDLAENSAAFEHPLGFVCFPLGSLNESTFRLHYWPETRPKIDEGGVHNHIFDLDSYILYGNIIDQTIRIDKSTETEFQMYEVRYTPGGSQLHATGKYVQFVIRCITEYVQGEFYRIQAGEFHASAVPAKAVTLIRKTKTHEVAPLVVAKESAAFETHSRNLLDPNAKCLVIQEIQSMLAQT